MRSLTKETHAEVQISSAEGAASMEEKKGGVGGVGGGDCRSWAVKQTRQINKLHLEEIVFPEQQK